MKYDKHTTRSYLGLEKNLDTNTINWLETVSSGTGGFDRALAEMVLGYIGFGTDEEPTLQCACTTKCSHVPPDDKKSAQKFVCLKGGSEILPKAMKAYIDKKRPNAIQLNKRVVGIKAATNNDASIGNRGYMSALMGKKIPADTTMSSRRFLYLFFVLPTSTRRN